MLLSERAMALGLSIPIHACFRQPLSLSCVRQAPFMRTIFSIILLSLAVTASSFSEGYTFKPFRFTVGDKVYEMAWSKEDLGRAKWDYESSDFPPLSPRAVYAKAREAFVKLRSETENWQSLGFELNLSSAGSYYSAGFRLISTDGKKVSGFLTFLVFMDGQVRSPKVVQ